MQYSIMQYSTMQCSYLFMLLQFLSVLLLLLLLLLLTTDLGFLSLCITAAHLADSRQSARAEASNSLEDAGDAPFMLPAGTINGGYQLYVFSYQLKGVFSV
jgi:hypothetical protein